MRNPSKIHFNRPIASIIEKTPSLRLRLRVLRIAAWLCLSGPCPATVRSWSGLRPAAGVLQSGNLIGENNDQRERL
jgi:hypothetical protein